MADDIENFDIATFTETKALLRDRFPTTIKCFFDDSDEYMAEILKGFEEGDKETVIFNAHPLKSSSHAFGMLSVAEIAKDIEHKARQAEESGGELDSAIPQKVEKIKAALAFVKDKIQAHM